MAFLLLALLHTVSFTFYASNLVFTEKSGQVSGRQCFFLSLLLLSPVPGVRID